MLRWSSGIGREAMNSVQRYRASAVGGATLAGGSSVMPQESEIVIRGTFARSSGSLTSVVNNRALGRSEFKCKSIGPRSFPQAGPMRRGGI
jgi:hypothetical protein